MQVLTSFIKDLKREPQHPEAVDEALLGRICLEFTNARPGDLAATGMEQVNCLGACARSIWGPCSCR